MDESSDPMIDRIDSDTGRFAMVPEWLIGACRPRALLIYVHMAVLCDYSTGDLTGISHETIAARAGCSPDTVLRSLFELRDLGAITWTRGKRDDGSRDVNTYRMTRVRPVENRTRKSAVAEQECGSGTRKDAGAKTIELLDTEARPHPQPVENMTADRPATPTLDPNAIDTARRALNSRHPRRQP